MKKSAISGLLEKQKKFWSQKSSLPYIAVLVLAAIPIVTVLVLLVRYSVNTPWWDQLSFVDLMVKLHNGTLSITDLWRQHNEHRILVPQAIELAIGSVTGFNFRFLVFMNFVMITASFGFLLSLLKRTFDKTRTVMWLAVPFAWILYTPFQWVNMIWGFQLAFFLCIFFTILTIWLLTGPSILKSWPIFALALFVATLTTYCNGNGLLIWPIGLAIILWRRTDRTHVLLWCGVGAVIIGSYLYDFRRSPDSPHLSVLLREPVAVVKYALSYLGRILSTAPTASRYMGAMLLLVMILSVVYVYKQGKLNKIIAWLALGAYVVMTALLAAASRLNFGVDHSFNSNSSPTTSLLFILATLAVTAYAAQLYIKAFNRKKLKEYAAVFFCLGFLATLPLPAFVENYTKGVGNIKDLGQHLSLVKDCVYEATSADDDCLTIVLPSKPEAWGYIKKLKMLRWGDFR